MQTELFLINIFVSVKFYKQIFQTKFQPKLAQNSFYLFSNEKIIQYNIEIMILPYLYLASNLQNDNIQFFSRLEMKANKSNCCVIYWGKFERPSQHFFSAPCLTILLFNFLSSFFSFSVSCVWAYFQFQSRLLQRHTVNVFLNMRCASCS